MAGIRVRCRRCLTWLRLVDINSSTASAACPVCGDVGDLLRQQEVAQLNHLLALPDPR
jgi:hypothetical protein